LLNDSHFNNEVRVGAVVSYLCAGLSGLGRAEAGWDRLKRVPKGIIMAAPGGQLDEHPR